MFSYSQCFACSQIGFVFRLLSCYIVSFLLCFSLGSDFGLTHFYVSSIMLRISHIPLGVASPSLLNSSLLSSPSTVLRMKPFPAAWATVWWDTAVSACPFYNWGRKWALRHKNHPTSAQNGSFSRVNTKLFWFLVFLGFFFLIRHIVILINLLCKLLSSKIESLEMLSTYLSAKHTCPDHFFFFKTSYWMFSPCHALCSVHVSPEFMVLRNVKGYWVAW